MFSKWSIQLKYSMVFILTLALIIFALFIGIEHLKTNLSVKLPDRSVFEFVQPFLNPYTIGLMALAFLLNFLFTHRAIIKRLQALALTTERIAQGELDLPLHANLGSRDEVDNTRQAIDLLRNSLVVAMKRLEKNRP